MIDSKFSDIDPIPEFNEKVECQQQFKIYGDIYNENSIYNNEEILEKQLIKQFKNVINPDNFRHKISVDGGGEPDETIINLLDNIHNHTFENITDLIPIYFPEFVHNRVGTLLLKSEKDNITKLSKPDFTRSGSLMVYQKRYEEYIWVIYLKQNKTQRTIITKEGDNYTQKDVFPGSLFGYPKNEKIIPEQKKNMKYDENNIYETYNLE